MTPLYISATNTIIRSVKERYIHPQTGEVYGNTDYADPKKLAEIGAIPLTEEGAPHADADVQDGTTLVVAPDGKSATRTLLWRSKTAEEVATATKALAERTLAASDLGMARVVEDLIATLIAKGVIAKADLPQAAVRKLTDRETLRVAISDKTEAKA
jgi:hypothetical protein